MSGPLLRPALWALVLVSSLAPSLADGNIGCLFSTSLCVEGVEWCYDDYAFGKCIPIYEEEPEDGSLYQYDMSSADLQWFESELQRLVARGYRWEHAYTQCVLQAMLYTRRRELDPAQVNRKICDHFADPKLEMTAVDEPEASDERTETEVDPDATAYIRFTPNSAVRETDYANEIYNPPVDEDDLNNYIPPPDALLESNGLLTPNEDPSDKLRNYILMKEESEPPMTFGGFRERLQEEKERDFDDMIENEKKSLPIEVPINDDGETDEDRLNAHFRKMKNKIVVPPFTAEYITGNRFSPLDAEVRSNALEKYKQSFAEKNFPFEYENPDNEIPEPRVYFEDDVENYGVDTGSGELDPNHYKDLSSSENAYQNQNMQYLINYWKMIESRLKPQETLYAEGGPLKMDDLQGDSGNAQKLAAKGGNHDHSSYDHDPSYAFVKFNNRFGTDWKKGIEFISRIEELLGLEKNTLTNPRVDPNEVTFKVEKNSKGLEAADVARRVLTDEVREELRRQTGAVVSGSGVGDRSKRPMVIPVNLEERKILGLQIPVLLSLIGSLTVLAAAGVVFALLLHKDSAAKRKLAGLTRAVDGDAEATNDYQELCRARMSGKFSGQQTTTTPHPAEQPPRIASLTKEAENNSPSTRSSTSSWSEEPALTNMDISTGHMVLAYMEDHLRNKDRLEQEWRALCAYEAEPCATTAALKPENKGKNRYTDVLPYDHSRVTLNTLSNHLGSDYINASTITDHDPRNPAYIACAGPLAATAPDFWQLVWEQGSVVMVMLTRLTESGEQLCHRYWPEEGSELYHIYEVHLVSEHIWCDDYLVRSFYLKNQRTGETRTVTQFHFLSWPENGVPSSTKALLEFRRKVNKSYRGRSCPIVVHCSDGAGRTGTYCLIDMVLNRMAKGAKEIDIAATLEHIRDQRPRTVATKMQFEFVLMAVAEEVHAILKALPAHLAQLQEKKDKEKDKEKEKEKDSNEREK
ncbi:receptor-type tyrosine-protein phosphatase N2 isoform X3 [Plutella xylostella]|uniref:receptor-type tyrosine-protein phosphatase N2 isoform X3 n=1 Tax=Plutella xylostella TaxID=51655 RepID=UPI0020321D2E|nr:receptor-type tyrosine-protein phosphatase N2 isoform X3 [Plutella xylostella]